MNVHNRELRERAAELAAEYRGPARRLVLLYCGVLAVLTLGSSGLNLFLDSRIGSTGGLDGIGMRSILETIQQILSYINQFFGPFWSAGFLTAMIAMVRGREPQVRDLTNGFRRVFRVLFHVAFEATAAFMLLVAVVNLSSLLFMLSPMGAEFNELMAPLLTDPNLLTAEGLLNEALISYQELSRLLLPMLVLTAAIYLPLYTLMAYSFRLSLYLVMDRNIGAIPAHFLSIRLMRGHKWQLCKLDLSWWWYYLLGAACWVVGYLDLLLGMLGIPLPMNATVMFFVTLAAYCVLFTLLSLWKKCEVDASYVLFYENVMPPEPETAEE
ncbi:MAG: DUF975 family protein [Oscillospiraceae bacterium]|nr:DUF975 family protein [Oscillospiraceae bacterium]